MATGMDKQLYEAAVQGNKTIFFTDAANEYFLKKNPQMNNIIHVAVRHEKLKFIREAVKRFPELIGERNRDGDNPLHLAAQTGNLTIMKLLLNSYKAHGDGDEQQLQRPKPWRDQNEEGNNPLHVALIHCNIRVALFLVDKDGPDYELPRIPNKSKETPLHLAIRYHVDADNDRKALQVAGKLVLNELVFYDQVANNRRKKVQKRFMKSKCRLEKDSMCVINSLLQKERLVACWRDIEDMTPLLRAVTRDPPYIPAIKAIVNHCPESAEVCDGSGRSLLHLLNNLPNYLDYKYLFNASQVESLKNNRDNKGNTPTHIALQKQKHVMFLFLLISRANLAIRNKEGVSAADLIRKQSDHFWELCRKQIDGNIGQIWLEDEAGPTLSEHEVNAINDMNIEFLRKRIQEVGISFFLKKKTQNGGNILHAIEWKDYGRFIESQKEFIQQALETWPSNLMCQINSSGKTPLHKIAEYAPEVVDKCFLEKLRQDFEKIQAEAASNIEEVCYDPPWKAKDLWGDTPLHLAIRRPFMSSLPIEAGLIKCAKEMLELDPELAVEVNNRAETPLHLLCYSSLHSQVIMEDVKFILDKSEDAVEMEDENGLHPLHIAARFEKMEFVNLLLTSDFTYPWRTDGDGNTFWHHLAGCSFHQEEELPSDGFAVLSDQNNDGNTPLHLAVKNENFQLAKTFNEIYLKQDGHESLDLILGNCNKEGKTVLHLVAGRSDKPFAKEFVKHALENSQQLKDAFGILICKDGNTPLHEAIFKEDFKLVEMIIQSAIEKGQLDELLEISNKKGETIGGLIGSEQHLPKEFEDFLWGKPKVVEAMVGVRSLSGISTKMIKEYANTIGVTAALFATITFTAGFTVPGGLNSSNGTPVLMKKATFQVFIVSDILALCLSMMVLFCLLWIMTIGSKKDQVVLLDLTVFLHQTSFYATLLTFMMGLYETVFPITHWIAIMACALCSLLILLMHKQLIIKFIPYFIKIYVHPRKTYASIRESIGFILPSCPTNYQNNGVGSRNYTQDNTLAVTIQDDARGSP